ncbi:MAG: hypothetical protein ABI132_10915 [Rhodanobacteraceae bacterium]
MNAKIKKQPPMAALFKNAVAQAAAVVAILVTRLPKLAWSSRIF